MLSKEIFINKRILVYGLGLSGNSCLKYLNKNLNSSSKLVISDYNKGVVTNEVLN